LKIRIENTRQLTIDNLRGKIPQNMNKNPERLNRHLILNNRPENTSDKKFSEEELKEWQKKLKTMKKRIRVLRNNYYPDSTQPPTDFEGTIAINSQGARVQFVWRSWEARIGEREKYRNSQGELVSTTFKMPTLVAIIPKRINSTEEHERFNNAANRLRDENYELIRSAIYETCTEVQQNFHKE